jgi:hypothetical protein
MGRGVEHFYTEGTKLANCTVPDPFLERAKTADLARKASKETDGKVAAQESEGSRDISPQY